jgi:hypothetical protein
MNQIVAALTGGYCHVEIYFQDPSDNLWYATSIWAGEKLFKKPRNFTNTGYTSIAITLDDEQMRKLKWFVDTHAGYDFDDCGMYCAICPVELYPKQENKIFCSRYVLEALQFCGMDQLDKYNPAIVSPSQLYRIISSDLNDRRVVGALPSKLNRMQEYDVDTGDVNFKGDSCNLITFWNRT